MHLIVLVATDDLKVEDMELELESEGSNDSDSESQGQQPYTQEFEEVETEVLSGQEISHDDSSLIQFQTGAQRMPIFSKFNFHNLCVMCFKSV